MFFEVLFDRHITFQWNGNISATEMWSRTSWTYYCHWCPGVHNETKPEGASSSGLFEVTQQMIREQSMQSILIKNIVVKLYKESRKQ